jgi:hypothetical protein
MKHINIPHELNKIDIADLHTAFKKLKIDVAPAKRRSDEMDAKNICNLHFSKNLISHL